jgi:predicted helicase
MSTPSQRNFSHRPLWRSPASCDELLRSIESWDEFLKVVKGLGKTKEANKWKGDIFERLVQLFLQHSPEYQLQLETVWLYAEIPVKLKEQLNLSDNERGIDLLAKTKKGEYWGVQAKYRADESGSMPLRKLGTFGTQVAAVSKGLSRGLICATKREKTPDFANATFDFEHILLDRWESLPAEFWEAVRQAAAGKKVEPLVPRNPHQYQMAAIDAATLHFIEKANRRGKLIMPCGTGKSLMGYWTAIVALKATTVVVAVPSLDLIRQTFAAWAREAVANRLPLDALIVCSDKSTSSEGDTHTSDLSTPVTTDPGEIRAWLNAPGAEECVRVVFVTYQSGKVLADAVGRFQFDVGLFDEAHKTAGPEGKANQHLLHEENLRIQRRVFMTATERYYVGESDEVVGMNDVKIYGERYHYMSFGDAIAQGILADYSVVLMDVSESDAEGYRELIEERIYVAPEQSSDSVLLPERLTAEDLGAAVALRKAIHKYRLRHAISFHSRNRYAKDFVAVQKALNGKGLSAPIDTYRVSSDLSAGQRHKQIKGFEESNRALISNARCLTEGVDVPGIDLVMFAQPRQSKVDIVQAVGRALRKPADQLEKHGYVLVPILVKDGDLDLEEIVNGSGFENLVSVLKAMATVDADVTERISIVLGEGTRKGGKKGPGSSGTEDVIPRALDLASFADALRLRAWDRLSLIKPRVTIEQILQWADAHKERVKVRIIRPERLVLYKNYNLYNFPER